MTPFGVCSGAGTCTDGVCTCGLGYVGQNCNESNVAGCPRQCSGHGQCDPESLECVCDKGYEGYACQATTGCAVLSFCSGHGSCKEDECSCDSGWNGPECSERKGCANECSGWGSCELGASKTTFECNCRAPSSGSDDCSRALPVPCPLTCSGHGICVANEGRCKCHPGFSGPACDVVLSLCNQSCHHGHCAPGVLSPLPFAPTSYAATSVTPSGKPSCRCRAGFEGDSCNRRSPSAAACATRLHCSGHGVCDQATARCLCDAGFTGPSCHEVDLENACSNGCSGHGKCIHGARRAYCVCSSGWKGNACEESECDVGENELVCSGRGLCLGTLTSTNRTSYECTCDDGYAGDSCGDRMLSCPGDCAHGACIDSACVCKAGYTGNTCAIPANISSQDVVCCPYDCSDNGVCDMDACRCICNQEWGGVACNTFEAGDDMG